MRMKPFLGLVAGFLLGLVASAPALAAQTEMLPVAAVTIYPGETIVDGMLTSARFPAGTSRNRMVAAVPSQIIGKVARRTLIPGRIIAQNAIGEPELVTRGTIVPVVYQSNALVITASVVALQSGGLDSLIQVRNVDSGKVIVGVVQADGSVRVNGQ